MKGSNTHIIKYIDVKKAIVSKLDNRKRKVNIKKYRCLRSCHPFLLLVVKTKCYHNFIRYFHELSDDELRLVRDPFKLSVERVPDGCHNKFLELKTDPRARDMFDCFHLC